MGEPPEFAERIVRWLVGGRDADAVAGDLREQFAGRGRLWYWRQALSCAAVRFSWHRRMLPGLGMDFHHTLRTIRRNPGYAATAMVCLGLAMGVNTTLFALLDSLYFRKLPVQEPDRIVKIERERNAVCYWSEYLDFRGSLRSVETTAWGTLFSQDVIFGRSRVHAIGELVSADFADVLRLRAAAGRWFARGDDAPAATPSVVIGYRFWKSRMNGDAAALGSVLRTEAGDFHVIGIAPDGFDGSFPPFSIDLWFPLAGMQGNVPMALLGRLRPGATVESAAAEFRVIDARLRADPHDPRAPYAATVRPFTGLAFQGGVRRLAPLVRMMSWVCGAVLLIACVNVANLLLARAAVRQRELEIRRALGATRWRMFRARLLESLLLAAGGAAIGIVAGRGIGRVLELALPAIPEEGLRGLQFGLDWRIAGYLAAVCGATALLFTAASGRAGAARRRAVYPVAQVSLSLALLIATGLLLRGIEHARTADPGFATDRRMVVEFFDPQGRLTALLDRARAVPGIEDATLARVPLGTISGGCATPRTNVPPRRVNQNVVEPNYFDLMRIPIVRGGGFTDAPGLLVNEAMAQALWPGEDPVGKPLWTGCAPEPRSVAPVVGVVRDVAVPGDDAHVPAYYLSRRRETGMTRGIFTIVVRTAGDPYRWRKALADAMQAEVPDLRLYEMTSVHDAISESLWRTRWEAGLLGGVAALAILLAAIGLYGVVACSVAQRTSEIGVRMAVGAQPGDVQWMFVGQGLRITAAGVAIGLALSSAVARLLRASLYGLSPFDPVAFAAAALAWVAVAMLASWWPARRATRVDPQTALKYE